VYMCDSPLHLYGQTWRLLCPNRNKKYFKDFHDSLYVAPTRDSLKKSNYLKNPPKRRPRTCMAFARGLISKLE
jgi:hypothetical protein